MRILNLIKFWMNNARYYSLGQSAWAAFAAIIMAMSYSDEFNLLYALIALLGVLAAHLTVNLLDDYFDYKSGSVNKRNELKKDVRTGKCTYLLEGKATLSQLFICAGVFGIFALICGAYLFAQRGLPILVITFIAFILGYFYSAPPFCFSYKGLGEIIVGLMFGPLLMNGVFYCACGTVSLAVLIMSFALGSLVINILYVHSLMDMKIDKEIGKTTLATILPNNFLRLVVLVFFAIYPYWLVAVGVYKHYMPKFLLGVFITIPLTFALIKLMIDYLYENKKECLPCWWMGKMEHWEKIKSANIEWFMIRWFLARNITIYYSFIVCLVYFIKSIG